MTLKSRNYDIPSVTFLLSCGGNGLPLYATVYGYTLTVFITIHPAFYNQTHRIKLCSDISSPFEGTKAVAHFFILFFCSDFKSPSQTEMKCSEADKLEVPDLTHSQI